MKLTLTPKLIQRLAKLFIFYKLWQDPKLNEIEAIRAWLKEMHELETIKWRVPFRNQHGSFFPVFINHWKPGKARKEAIRVMKRAPDYKIDKAEWKREVKEKLFIRKNPQW